MIFQRSPSNQSWDMKYRKYRIGVALRDLEYDLILVAKEKIQVKEKTITIVNVYCSVNGV
jgi:hypothetical protein